MEGNEIEKHYRKVPTVDLPQIDELLAKKQVEVKIFEKQIPNRQWCDMCGGLCRIIFWIPDDIWLECIPKHHWTSRVCIECFMERADEKFLPWDKHIKIISLDSFYSQREVQQMVEKK